MSPRIKVDRRLFDVSPDAKLLYFGGSWDNSVRVYNIKSGKQIAYVVRHTGQCLIYFITYVTLVIVSFIFQLCVQCLNNIYHNLTLYCLLNQYNSSHPII